MPADVNLSEYERKILAEIEPQITVDQEDIDTKLSLRLIEIDTITLVKLAYLCPKLDRVLSQIPFLNFWDNVWSKLGSNAPGASGTMHYQENISSQRLVYGYIFYLLSLQQRLTSNTKFGHTEHQLLKIAASYDSFHALSELMRHNIAVLPAVSDIHLSQHIQELIELGNQAANAHKTPGYLLLVDAYTAIANHHAQSDDHDSQVSAYHALYCAFKNLKLAELYQEASSAAIQNAYFGQGIIASNPYELSSISTIQNALADLTAGRIKPLEITSAYSEAQQEFDHVDESSNPTPLLSCKEMRL